MKPVTRRLILALLGLVALVPLAPARAPGRLRVLTSIPDLADLVQAIGGERVEVDSITRGKENLHAVVARPSHLVAMSRADLFVEVGLSLEVAFVPGLLEGARNERVKPGAKGFVNVSEGWSALDVPAELSRKAGDVHPQGNPHLNLDPRAGRHMAQRIFEGLVRVDPEGEKAYRAGLDAYLAQLAPAEERWATLSAPWKGRKVVVYHQEYNYLAAQTGLEILAAIETKPGIPPTPNHIAELIQKMKAAGCKTILTAAWSRNKDVERLAEATGARIVELPNQCGGSGATSTWIGMMDELHARVA
ncbi:MAG: metal ABC transporter substrate-binding protein, partial [Planctomycetota bacterium]